ncbi:MAG: hypothetical protein HYZ50_20280 [Deltaproteobacteria bacterium]|nr:hypothetical protein [Deltaproteobacteria bacterium]
MDPKTTSTNEDWGTWLLQEIKVIAAQAVGVVAALWVRHLVMRAIDGKVLDKNIVQNGLRATPAQPSPSNLPVPVTAPRQEQSAFSQFRERPLREGPGMIWIPEIQRNLRYRLKYNLRDGTALYDHDETLNRGHQHGPCPLLKVRTDCWNCQHHVESPHMSEPICVARTWMEDVQDPDMSLHALANMSR